MPLSEEEQRILREMEQRLYEHDRAFVDRVRTEGHRDVARTSARWTVAVFLAGFVILLVSFRSSLVLGTFGFVVMLLASLAFEHHVHLAHGAGRRGRRTTRRLLGTRLSTVGSRLRAGSKRRRDR